MQQVMMLLKSCDKVKTIDTIIFVLKTQYKTNKSSLEKKIDHADKKRPDTSGL